MTQASPMTRDGNMSGFIQNDLLGCAAAGAHRVSVVLSLRLVTLIKWPVAHSADQDQTAQNVKFDLGSTLFENNYEIA